MSKPLKNLVERFTNSRIMVIGDVFLDEYVSGTASRLSREAAIPVLEFQSRRFIPGGAANPAANIAALGADAVLIGVVGEDDAHHSLAQTLTAHSISPNHLIPCSDRPTTVKTRILAQMGLRFPQQVARIDTLSRESINEQTEVNILQKIEQNLENTHAILFSDYHTGLLTKSLVDKIRDMTQASGILLTSDTQGQLEKYAGCHLVKCNADDAQTHLGRDLKSDEDFAAAAQELFIALNVIGGIVITRGSDGATLATGDDLPQHLPAPKVRDVFDTVGAGDTAIAVMTLALAVGANYAEAVQLANFASGIVVQRVGNYAPSPQELLDIL